MTRVGRIAIGFMFVVLIGGLASVNVGAQQAPPAQTQTTAQTQATPPQTVPLPQELGQLSSRYEIGQARPPVDPGTELVELTLDQAYAIALEKNLDLKVARMAPISLDYTLQSMRAAYKPNFNASYGYNNSLTPSNNVLEGVASVTSISQSYRGGVSQAFKYYGSPSVSASWTNSRSSTNNVTARLNPGYNTGLNLSFSMQLLRGFKIDNNRNQWRTYPITREIADITLLNSIESVKNQVRTSYWNLRQAIEAVEISRIALETAKKSWQDSLTRVEIGTAAPIDTVQFETQVTQNEQSYLASEISWRNAELAFKRLLVSGTDDELYRKAINPVDIPKLSVQTVDIQGAVTKALAESTNILVTRKNLEVQRLGFEVTKGNLRPSLSFSAGWGASGQGGTQHLSGGVIVPGGYGDAFSNLGSFSNPSWSMSFSIQYPLGQLSEKAAVATGQISIDQSVARLKAQELTISTSVVNAGLAVENAYKQYLAAVKSRQAQEKNSAAQQVRFENGLITNFEVVQSQTSVTNARLSEMRAIISYMNALAEFDRVQRIGG